MLQSLIHHWVSLVDGQFPLPILRTGRVRYCVPQYPHGPSQSDQFDQSPTVHWALGTHKPFCRTYPLLHVHDVASGPVAREFGGQYAIVHPEELV